MWTDPRLEPYEAMVRRYVSFTVSPGEGHHDDVTTTFDDGRLGARLRLADETAGDRATYERMRAYPKARLVRFALDAGDLERRIDRLAAGHFGPSDPQRPVVDAYDTERRYVWVAVGEPDERLVDYTHTYEGRYVAAFRGEGLSISVGKFYHNIVEVAYHRLHGPPAFGYAKITIPPHGTGPGHMSDVSDDDATALRDASSDAGDRRVAYVERIDARHGERAVHAVHAALAFVASKGLVSGESLVAFRAATVPATSAAQHAMRPLGAALLVTRARDLAVLPPRARRRRSLAGRRGAEIGSRAALYTAP